MKDIQSPNESRMIGTFNPRLFTSFFDSYDSIVWQYSSDMNPIMVFWQLRLKWNRVLAQDTENRDPIDLVKVK